MNKLKTSLILLVLGSCMAASAQKYEQQVPAFATAVDLFENQKYSAAQQYFQSALKQNIGREQKTDASFYSAICALRLFNPDGVGYIQHFIENNPQYPRIYQAYFELGNYLFHEEQYKEALDCFEKTDIQRFTNSEVLEYFYKKAYSYYKMNDIANANNEEKKNSIYTEKSSYYELAKPLFREVKDNQRSPYSENALFYYSYIEYVDGNYETAMNGFMTLSDSSMFAPVVAPYICQIYYQNKEYDKLIQYGKKVETTINPKYLGDVYRVMAGAYYKTLQYQQALPYYEKYFASSPAPTKVEYYELGQLYYRLGEYQKAVDKFQNVTSENDTIAQNAYYHMADCYLKLGEKEKARNVFYACSQYSVFPEITENATFCYAKLTYELSFAPFNEAITAMQNFMNLYPKSKYMDEANGLMVKIFMSSRNYGDALKSLEGISNLSSDLKMAYQQIAYYRGLELFNNLDYKAAIEMFNKSMEYGIYDRVVNSYCLYWKAESNYKLQQYNEALALYKDYIIAQGAFGTQEYERAHYNIAYTYFEKEDYASAAMWYRKYIDLAKDKKSDIYTDALIRTGDSYYMLKDFASAVKYYGQAEKIGRYDVEYALFQEAFCQGLDGNQSGKITTLTTFLKTYVNSTYYDDALYEQAEAYMKVGENQKAIENYKNIINNYKSSSYVKRALLQYALLEYNSQNIDKALDMYKGIVEQYPGSQESVTALNMIQNIYRKKNDIDTYSTYLKQIGGYSDITEAHLDSLSYEVIEEAYLEGDCDKAMPLMQSYLQKYGDGFFKINVHYYLGDCLNFRGYQTEALPHFEYVIQQPKNGYTEQALVYASQILMNYFQYEQAIPYLVQLETTAEVKPNVLLSRKLQIEAYAKLKEYKKLIETVENFIVTEKATQDDKRWANMNAAIAYDSLADTTNALVKYRTVALEISTAEGSEAKYRAASLLFDQNRYSESEKEIIEFLEKNSPHQYWLGKSYILWAKIFIARNELFQARYTLQNVLQHYKIQDDGIINEVNDMLDLITDIEMQQKAQESQSVEIEQR
ncbi:MAG: tetratricopeptide repeat protein [Bacteroidales bacterium]|nr:tetratricopeptide repeat protein [Bacteroidales bacterium]